MKDQRTLNDKVADLEADVKQLKERLDALEAESEEPEAESQDKKKKR